jgi:hypothetical protein
MTYGVKADLSYSPSITNRIDFGASVNWYEFDIGKLIPLKNSDVEQTSLQNDYSVEQAFYLGDEIRVSSRLSLSAGFRLSSYSARGPSDVLIYQQNAARTPTSIIDTVSYSKNESIKRYTGWEPRVSVKLSIDELSSIKFSYNRTYQYLHLISNTTAISPLDLWKSSNTYLKPQMGDQIALGYFRNFLSGIESSVEVYYKGIKNMVEYKDGADLFLNPAIESVLIPADGLAYGAELLLRKNTGKLTGWVGYTYSRTLRKTTGEYESEVLNKGEYYPSNFDKPHDLTLVLNYKITRRFSFSGNFTYSTGRPVTYPQSVYVIDGYAVSNYSDRNQGRIPDYHRLDLSFTVNESLRLRQKWKGSWTFSVFNVYGRKNPYSVFFKSKNNGKNLQSYRLSVLGTVFPSITYNFKF